MAVQAGLCRNSSETMKTSFSYITTHLPGACSFSSGSSFFGTTFFFTTFFTTFFVGVVAALPSTNNTKSLYVVPFEPPRGKTNNVVSEKV